MKILFEDVAKNNYSSISSTYESANYPATNITNDFAKLRYQMTAPSGDYDTITIQLDDYYKINSMYLNYSNANTFVIRFYADTTLLNTETIYSPSYDFLATSSDDYIVTSNDDYLIIRYELGEDCLSAHFTEVIANKIEIDVYGSEGTYLGKFACGNSVEFPDPVHSWTEGSQDSSSYIESPDGQTKSRYYKPLKEYSLTFANMTRQKASDLRDYFINNGTGKLLFIDITEDNSDFLAPIYGKITQVSGLKKNYKWYNVTWTFREAR